jgi:hypothetical protein
MFEGLANDVIALIKVDGTTYNNVKADVQPTTIYIGDSTLPVEEGDHLARVLPNGLTEKYLVIDRGYYNEWAGEPAHYQVKVRKESTIKLEQKPSQVNYYLNGNNTRVNIDSTDNSTNTVHYQTSSNEVFSELKRLIEEHVDDPDKKAEIVGSIVEMEKSQGTSSFTDKYKSFISVTADHLSLISPLLPTLSQMLVS